MCCIMQYAWLWQFPHYLMFVLCHFRPVPTSFRAASVSFLHAGHHLMRRSPCAVCFKSLWINRIVEKSNKNPTFFFAIEVMYPCLCFCSHCKHHCYIPSEQRSSSSGRLACLGAATCSRGLQEAGGQSLDHTEIFRNFISSQWTCGPIKDFCLNVASRMSLSEARRQTLAGG